MEPKIKKINNDKYIYNPIYGYRLRSSVINTYCDEYHIQNDHSLAKTFGVVVVLGIFAFGVFNFITSPKESDVRVVSQNTSENSAFESNLVSDKDLGLSNLIKEDTFDSEVDLVSLDF